MSGTAVLVDGNYYLHRAGSLWGRDVDPDARADELYRYALAHIRLPDTPSSIEQSPRSLHRLFYYDCPPLENAVIWQPWDGKSKVFNSKNPTYVWKRSFTDALLLKRKVALRMGSLTVGGLHYTLRDQALRGVLNGEKDIHELGKRDYRLVGLKQSGVDMRIGLDVAQMAAERVVERIVLIAGDSDFVPAVKVARRAGVDVLLDPMGLSCLREDLVEHSDGVEDLSSTFDPMRLCA